MKFGGVTAEIVTSLNRFSMAPPSWTLIRDRVPTSMRDGASVVRVEKDGGTRWAIPPRAGRIRCDSGKGGSDERRADVKKEVDSVWEG